MDWGSCVLRVAGERLDPDTFLASSSLKPYAVHRRGEPLAPVGRRSQQRHEMSGFKCDVSDAASLKIQIQDAIAFLKLHHADLVKLANDGGVEVSQLDFGYQCRLGDGVAIQGECLPPEILSLAGQLKIGIALSLYPTSNYPADSEE